MIVRQTFKVYRNFARIIKPKLSKYQNVFELMKDRIQQFKFIERRNQQVLNTTKQTTYKQLITKRLGISDKASQEVANTVLYTNAFSPIWMRPYRISQKLGQNIKVQDNESNVEGLYRPGHSELKFHYSINRDVPNIEQYKINKSTAYIFNLPEDVTEKQLLMELGYRLIKSVKIKQCMIGLPAYAIVQFNSESHLADKFINNQLEINIGNKTCTIVTETEGHKLLLNRRQLVLKDIGQDQTPASILDKLSAYGRVINLNLPMNIYKQQTLQQIKQLYKNQRLPIKLNFYRKNGTIQSQYYPPFQPSTLQGSLLQQKQQQYNRRLTYSQNVNIYQGEQGKVKIKAKGFCIVTFSCQQQAQNCYFQLRNTIKMQLLNGRDQFQFDQKHYKALLRFIDNQFIQNCKQNNPTKDYDEQTAKGESVIFQSLYLRLLHQQIRKSYYKGSLDKLTDQEDDSQLDAHFQYKRYLNELKSTIGQGNVNPSQPNSAGNMYGKSFDQLAEEQLYGLRLKERAKKQRYQVNIDDYFRKQPDQNLEPKRRRAQIVKEEGYSKLEGAIQAIQTKVGLKASETVEEGESAENAEGQGEEIAEETQVTSKIKHNFSTLREINKQYRPKTLQQKVKSHMRYNKFVRDTINEYLGIFPVQKLNSQFNKKKATFVNPQCLKFSNGQQFIKEDEIPRILSFSNSSTQTLYNQFVKENEICKSLNINIEQTLLKNFQDNQASTLHYYTDVGLIKQEYNYEGEDMEGAVKKLNIQAQFGQQYKIVSNESEGSKKIVKIAKLQHIYPLDLIAKRDQKIKSIKSQQGYDIKKQAIVKKYYQYFFNNQPIPDELAQAFGLQKNTIIDSAKFSEEVCAQLDVTKKDLQKLMNLPNYTEQQIQMDVQQQLLISKSRRRMEAKKASDFARDPSQIKVKDRKNKAVVSKVRQI